MRGHDVTEKAKIIWTKVDEAPALATYSFLPIVKAFASAAGVVVETRDISLAGRTAAKFPERLRDEQRVPDDLAELGELVKRPEANIVKLPCISASIPQLKAAIKELQDKGYDLPDYPEEPANDEANITWVRELIADMEEFSDGSRYLNFAGFQEEGDEMMRQSFAGKYNRLVKLKNKYDPTNFFRLNQNIKPATA